MEVNVNKYINYDILYLLYDYSDIIDISNLIYTCKYLVNLLSELYKYKKISNKYSKYILDRYSIKEELSINIQYYKLINNMEILDYIFLTKYEYKNQYVYNYIVELCNKKYIDMIKFIINYYKMMDYTNLLLKYLYDDNYLLVSLLTQIKYINPSLILDNIYVLLNTDILYIKYLRLFLDDRRFTYNINLIDILKMDIYIIIEILNQNIVSIDDNWEDFIDFIILYDKAIYIKKLAKYITFDSNKVNIALNIMDKYNDKNIYTLNTKFVLKLLTDRNND